MNQFFPLFIKRKQVFFSVNFPFLRTDKQSLTVRVKMSLSYFKYDNYFKRTCNVKNKYFIIWYCLKVGKRAKFSSWFICWFVWCVTLTDCQTIFVREQIFAVENAFWWELNNSYQMIWKCPIQLQVKWFQQTKRKQKCEKKK